MYLLKMCIGRTLIDRTEVTLARKKTAEERIRYLQLVATVMYWRNYRRVQAVKTEPTFFLDNVPSKMNSLTFFEEQELANNYPSTK